MIRLANTPRHVRGIEGGGRQHHQPGINVVERAIVHWVRDIDGAHIDPTRAQRCHKIICNPGIFGNKENNALHREKIRTAGPKCNL